MYNELTEINKRPKPFEFYTAADLWTDEYTSSKMLEYHLNEKVDISSRNMNFINRSTEWIIKHFELDSKSGVVDFGCGPGLYTIRYARKGINVTGIDFSGRSIEYARQKAINENLHIDYIHENYLGFESSKKFDLASMIFCDFCALSPGQRKIILGKFRKLLAPHGFVLLDVYSLKYYAEKKEITAYEYNQQNRFWSPDDHFSFINSFKYDDEKVILDKHTIIEKSGTRIIYNWLQCYSVDSIKKEFEENGLKITEIFADVSGAKYNEDSIEFAIAASIM